MTDPASLTSFDHFSVWELVSERLQAELPRQSYLTWFRPLEPLAFDGEMLTLQVPSQFYSEWIDSHYNQHLQRAAAHALGHKVALRFEVNSNGKKTDSRPRKEERVVPTVTNERHRESFDSRLNANYRFTGFVEGDCNRFARAASLAVAEAPGRTAFNPLMVYGGSGLGKTHLMQAIGNAIIEQKSARRVLYVTSEQFTIDFVEAIKSGRSESFGKLYRSVDVLLLDDVQFLMTKEKTQEEFFHTFNYLHQAGKQLVFSSDRPPRDLEGFDSRLVSRLQWGLVTEITVPEYETRLAILRRRADLEEVKLPEDVAHFLALHVTDNVRTLESALINILAQSSLIKKEISIELARETIRNLISKTERTLTVERIQAIVAEEFKFPSDLMRAKTRKKEIAEARHVAMYLCTEHTRLTLKAIGLYFGGRDHATIIHARESVNERMKADTSFNEFVEGLRRKLELSAL